jgi:hypothetical protein
VAPDGWIANNGAGDWVAPDGAHWGTTTPREQPPLRIASDAWTRQRAREHRDHRSHPGDERTAEPPEEAEGYQITKTPKEENAECEEWHTSRYGVTFCPVCEMDRDDLIAEGFVSHEAATGSEGHETAEDTGTTERTACGK